MAVEAEKLWRDVTTSQGSQQPSGAGGGRKGFSPSSLRGHAALLTELWPSELGENPFLLL